MTVTSPAGSASTAKARRTSAFRWVPAAAGWTVGIIATLSLLASVSPLFRWLIKVPREFVNDYIFNFPDTSFAWAFVLALLAAALAARKSIAWWILVGYMVAAVGWNVGDIVSGDESWLQEIGEIIGLAFHIAAIAFLVLARKEFWAKVRRGALIKAAATLVAGLAVGTLIGWGLIELFPGSLAREDRFFYALNRVGAFAGASSDSFTGHPHVLVNALLGLFGALALMVAAIVLFQSQRAENALTGEDESAIRGLLELYGKNDSLGYFATRRDKSVVFAPNGRAAITYRVEVGVCLASGDPVGDPKAWPQAIEAWLLLCQAYGWAPGVMGASSTAAEAFRAAGLNALQLGDEAILYPDNFRLSGPDMRAVRQAVTRARRAGATVRIRRHRDLDADEMATVVERADTWRDTDDERGFSMALGRLGDPADGDCLLVEAVQPGAGGDQVVAMLSLVPWGTNGASLDLMRRSPQSPNGTIELMVSELCLQAEGIGVSRISLNFAMFRSAFEQGAQLGAGPVARLWRALLVFFSRWWQLETLYRSNMKYQPEWVPRYACYEDARLVPRVGVASVIAEGFLVLPFSRRHEQPHTGHHTRCRRASSTVVCCTMTAPHLMSTSCKSDWTRTRRSRLPEQVRVRMAKLKTLQDSGIDAYPVGEAPSHTILAAIESEGAGTVTVAGRVLRIRDYGGVLFAQLRDWSGEVQLLLDNSLLEEGTTADFTHAIDLGDLIEVSGTMGFSKKGTRSLMVRELAADRQMPAPAARQVEGADRSGGPGTRPICRPGDQLRGPRSDPGTQRCSARDPRNPVRQRVSGGRDADSAADPRRRERQAVPDPHQRLRPRPVPADRARAVSQAAVRRRCRAGLRAGQGIPQRGRGLQPQPRVHAAGGLSGPCGLQRVDRRLPRADPERRAGRQRGARVHASPRGRARWSPSTSRARGRSRPCTARCRRRSASRSAPTPT